MKKHFLYIIIFLFKGVAILPTAALAQHNRVVTEGYLFQKGRMMQVSKGLLIPVAEQVVLENGLRVLPSGVLIQKNGIKHNLREGQALDNAGHILFPETRQDGTIILVSSPGRTAFPEHTRKRKNIPLSKAPEHHIHQSKEVKFKFRD